MLAMHYSIWPMMNRSYLVILFCCIHFTFYSQNVNIDIHFENPVFDHASVGLTIIDAESGETVYNHNGNLALIPASTLKTVTTFSALELLGPEFRFKTSLFLQGEKLGDGSFYGNLILKGSGDPSLGSPFFEKALGLDEIKSRIVKAIKAEGISCIEGTILIDNSLFEGSPVNETWQWNDLSNYYASGVWPFNIHENLFYINFDRSIEEFQPTSISYLLPKIPNIIIQSNVITGAMGSGDNAYVYSHPFSSDLQIVGTIPPGKDLFQIKAAIPNPGEYIKSELIAYFDENGITTSKDSLTNRSVSDPTEFISFTSAPLSEIVREANLKSNNLYCEAILKSIGTTISEKGSTNKGIKAVKNFLRLLELDVKSFTYKDGSGLSNRNRIPTAFIASYLQKIYQLHSSKYLEEHLSHASPDGDVTYLFNDSNEEYQVHLKSGSMSQVMAYCGIIQFDEKKYCFSFISNGHLQGNRRIRVAFEHIIQDFIQGRT